MPRQARIYAPSALHHIIAANENHINFHRNAQAFDICYLDIIQLYQDVWAESWSQISYCGPNHLQHLTAEGVPL
jgi:hypothetical protein